MFKRLLDRFGNTLYYPGCLTHFAIPEVEENYKEILKKLGIDFITLQEFSCCGSPVLNAGYYKDFGELKEKNLELLKNFGVSRIITSCPACLNTLNGYGLEVEHISQTVDRRLKKIKRKEEGEMTYHDPCHLGRKGKVYEEPRNVLRHIGLEVKELDLCRENSRCCGGGGGMKANFPEDANGIAKEMLEEVKTASLVTTCPLCYLHLKENASGIEVYEFSEVVKSD